MKSKTSKSQFKRRKSALKKYQATGSVINSSQGIQLGSSGFVGDNTNQFSGQDTSLSQNYGLTPEQRDTITPKSTSTDTAGPKSYAEWSGLDTAGQVQTAVGVAQGLGNIYGAATMDTSVDNTAGYYNKQTQDSIESSNRGVRDSQIASTTGQTIMAASAYAGPFAWIPMVVGGLITAGGEIGKAVHKGDISSTSGNYADRMAARGRSKQHAETMKKRNERFQDVNYFESTGNTYAKKGGLVKYKTGGNGVTRVYGDYHKDGGITVPFGEVENKEVLDESPITQKILKDSKKDSGMYVFSEYLNTDGTKGYDDPDKTSIADARMAIENADISPEQKLAKIAELMDNQEKGADRKAKFAKKNGGLMKYKTAGDVPEYKDGGETDPTDPPLRSSERDALIRTMYAEAANQGEDGLAAVAHVILNRTKDSRFPDNAYDVVHQDKQFSAWNDADMEGNDLVNIDENSKEYKDVAKILDNILSGESPDITRGATHYWNPNKANPNWGPDTLAAHEAGGLQIGDHVFAGKIEDKKSVSEAEPQERAVNTDPVATSLNKWGTDPSGYTPEELQGFYEDAQEQDRLQIEAEATGNPTGSTAFAGDYYDEEAGAFKPGMSTADNFYNKYSSAGADYVPASLEQIVAQRTQAQTEEQARYEAAQGGTPYPKDSTYEDLIAEYETRLEMDNNQIAAEDARARGEEPSDLSHPYHSTSFSGTYYDPETETWDDDYMSAQKFYDKYQLDANFDGVDRSTIAPPGTPPGGPSGPGGSTQIGPFVEGYGPSTDPNMYDAEGQMIGPVDFNALETGERRPFGPAGEEKPKKPEKGGMSGKDIGRLAAVGGMTAAQLAMLASANTDYADPISAYRRPRPLRVNAPRLTDTEYAAGVAERRYYDEELTKTTGPTGARRRELRQGFDRDTERRQMGINKYNADAYQWEQGLNVQNLNEYYNQLTNAQTLEESSRVSQSNAQLMTELSKRQAMAQSIGNVSAGLMGYWGDEDLARASQINGTYDRYKRS